MKKVHFIFAMTLMSVLVLTSCRTSISASGSKASVESKTSVTSTNSYDLDIASTPIIYTIDISTESGKLMLKKKSEKEVKEIITREAIIQNKCSVIFKPEYKFLKKGKKILKAQVYGFPAVYKKKD